MCGPTQEDKAASCRISRGKSFVDSIIFIYPSSRATLSTSVSFSGWKRFQNKRRHRGINGAHFVLVVDIKAGTFHSPMAFPLPYLLPSTLPLSYHRHVELIENRAIEFRGRKPMALHPTQNRMHGVVPSMALRN